MDIRAILNMLVNSVMAGNVVTEIRQATIEKNEARTQATATVELYIVDSTGAPHTSTITETFSL